MVWGQTSVGKQRGKGIKGGGCVLWSGKTRDVQIRCYSQSEIKTQTRSNGANQTGLLIICSDKGTRQ